MSALSCPALTSMLFNSAESRCPSQHGCEWLFSASGDALHWLTELVSCDDVDVLHANSRQIPTYLPRPSASRFAFFTCSIQAGLIHTFLCPCFKLSLVGTTLDEAWERAFEGSLTLTLSHHPAKKKIGDFIGKWRLCVRDPPHHIATFCPHQRWWPPKIEGHSCKGVPHTPVCTRCILTTMRLQI